RSRSGRRCNPFRRRRTNHVLVHHSSVDTLHGAGGLPHGEHLEVLQLQRHTFQLAAAVPVDCALRPVIRRNLVFLRAAAVCHRHALHVLGNSVAVAVDLPAPRNSLTAVQRGIRSFMSSNTKTPVVSHSEADRALYRVAIVGAGSLKGKEVAEVLGDRNFPAVDVKLLDDDEAIGQLETLRDEVTFVQNVRAEQFDNIDFTFFASDQQSTRKTWNTARKAGSAIVDLSYALEDEPGAVVRSPWVERQLGQGLRPDLQPGPAVIAHPAAVVLALLLLRV